MKKFNKEKDFNKNLVEINCSRCKKNFLKSRPNYRKRIKHEENPLFYCSQSCSSKARGERIRENIIVSDIISLYLDEKLSILEISLLKGVSVHVINDILKLNNIEIRKSEDYKKLEPPQVGERFNSLTFLAQNIKLSHSGRKVVYWECQCDCGLKKEFLRDNLLTSHTRSCGCQIHNILSTGETCKNKLFSKYRRDAEKKCREFSLDKNVFLELTQKNCFYCQKPPSSILIDERQGRTGKYLYNGIDRINSSKGYLVDNCVSCCIDCNRAKHTLSQSDFFQMIKNIYETHNLINFKNV
jgi:hypothetical protein